MYYILANYVVLSQQMIRLSIATVTSGLVSLLGAIVLIQANGAIGAAQAFLASQIVLLLITWWLAQRAHPVPWWRALVAWRVRQSFPEAGS